MPVAFFQEIEEIESDPAGKNTKGRRNNGNDPHDGFCVGI
jgi:hypothetical protein